MLSAEQIRVSFGGVVAVDRVDLQVHEAEIVGLVGPNGSGKSTFLNALTGVVRAEGRASLAGRPLPLGSPRRIRRAGLSRVFQAPQNFANLTCIENVLLADADRSLSGLGAAWFARPGMWRHERRRWQRAAELLDRVGLVEHAHDQAALLPYGKQRLLELARGLAGDPLVLLLDEPSAGLNAEETDRLTALLLQVHDEIGLPMLVVDHKIGFVEELTHRVVVLQLGDVIAEGTPEDIWADPSVIEAYLGTG